MCIARQLQQQNVQGLQALIPQDLQESFDWLPDSDYEADADYDISIIHVYGPDVANYYLRCQLYLLDLLRFFFRLLVLQLICCSLWFVINLFLETLNT